MFEFMKIVDSLPDSVQSGMCLHLLFSQLSNPVFSSGYDFKSNNNNLSSLRLHSEERGSIVTYGENSLNNSSKKFKCQCLRDYKYSNSLVWNIPHA